MEIDEELQSQLKNSQLELSVLGTFFKHPEWFFSYYDTLKNSDFSDGATRFFHIFLTDYIFKYNNEFSPALANTFASMQNTRLSGYKKYGGWKTIEQMRALALDEAGLIKAIENLKKYSLLRGLVDEGFNVENIIGHNRFNDMNAEDVASIVQSRLDTVTDNAIININKPKDIFANEVDFVDSFFERPAKGISTCFDFLNQYCLGLNPKDSVFWGACSNAGKGRSLMYIACYLTAVEQATVTLLENEMDTQRMAQCALTTMCNAPYAQKITGCKLNIPEKNIVTALYRDDEKNPIYRLLDKDGNYIETAEQYRSRVEKKSNEYLQVKEVARYLQTKVKNKLLFKDIASNYSDSALLRHVNSAIIKTGSDVVIYDTLKNAPSVNGISKIGSWDSLMTTATLLQESVAKIGSASAIFSFQLDRSAYHRRPDELNSDNIASCAQLLHIADEMIMFSHLKKEDYADYRMLVPENMWGEGKAGLIDKELDLNKNYAIFRIMKNRRAGGKDKMFITEIDLNKNTWNEIVNGELKCIKPRNSNKWNQ